MYKYQENYLWSYNHTDPNLDDIDKAYKTASPAKRRAFSDIWYEMRQLHGYGMRITGKSCFFFSCAYKYDAINHDTGEYIETRLVYHTSTKRVEFAI